MGPFLVLCPRIIRPAYRAKYTFALFLAAFILIYASDLPPLSRLFSLIISGIGTLVACYSTNYIEEDGRKHWYWFFLLLTFGALLNIVTTDNIGTLASQWEGMTWAAFALVADASELPPLSAFAQGVPAYPDRSATVLLAGLAFDAGTRFRGSGPGICGESTFTCTLPEDFAARWRENTSGFPLGVDMLLCGADGGAGLPRTTRLERLPQESAACM